MDLHIKAEIIAIGTEILLGEITDTNSVYIAQVLRDLGINLHFMTTVGDNEGRIASAIEIALGRADVVITCGGLGPTVDDMTRQGIAQATGRSLVFHPELLEQIATRFASFRTKMTENNKRQAYLPEDAIVIENPVGTAPSFLVEEQSKIIISLPGVPREMKYLMKEWVIPHLRERFQLGVIVPRVLKTAGIGESLLDEMLGTDLLEGSNPTIGLAAHHGIIDIRITTKAQTFSDAQAMLDRTEAEIMSRVGQYIFGRDQQTLEEVLVRLLQQSDYRITVIDAGIHSGICDRLLAYADAADVIAQHEFYENPETLRTHYQIPADLNLREMVERISESPVSGADQFVIVIASLPDVDENADVEYGTAVAVQYNNHTISRVYGFGAKNEVTKDWVSRWAMAYIWRILKESQQHE